ncbi:MAG: hypothetical protein R2705_17290 [Ilumatobacteraceae bacterium]
MPVCVGVAQEAPSTSALAGVLVAVIAIALVSGRAMRRRSSDRRVAPSSSPAWPGWPSPRCTSRFDAASSEAGMWTVAIARWASPAHVGRRCCRSPIAASVADGPARRPGGRGASTWGQLLYCAATDRIAVDRRRGHLAVSGKHRGARRGVRSERIARPDPRPRRRGGSHWCSSPSGDRASTEAGGSATEDHEVGQALGTRR